ncbi:AT-rich interactive domain-containing protein 1A-like isoform X2 [Tubulanus polymorphus]|uniref:AT-rich interactive domain-containing protein 1A-like isoform X2 n=1 Tax=Tubulanus polymorphus TaxID=672921 RepID=UPI003DA2DBA0
METTGIKTEVSSNSITENAKVKMEHGSDGHSMMNANQQQQQDLGHHHHPGMVKSEPIPVNDLSAQQNASMKREVNADYSRQNMNEPMVANDGYNRMNENIPSGPMSNYNSGGYGHGAYGGPPPPDQHHPAGSEYGAGPQNQYMNQFGPQGMRPGYPPGKGPVMQQMAGNMMQPPGYPSQRMMSGQSISQQSGPTPTLNQLLQTSTNAPPQRYPNFNADYGMNMQKSNDGNGGPNHPYNNPNWGQQRPPGMPGGPYPQQGSGANNMNNPMYRQPNPMYDPSQGRRQPNMAPGYPGQQQGQYPGQFQSSQRYPGPMPSPNRPMPNQMSHHPMNQQGYGRSPMNKQASPAPQPPPPPPQSQASPQPQPTQSLQDSTSQQPSPSPQQAPHTPGSQSQQMMQQDDSRDSQKLTNNSDDVNNSDSNSSARAGTPNSPHPSHLRPPPSPAGSTGSRSNTPASITGNQAGSPMPPRPPSSHVEGQNSMNQQQMASQQGGYNQQMMPPPMGPNQMAGYPSKMGHPGMMPGQQMPQYNSQYPQGNYGPRGPTPQQGMPGYMTQQPFNNANQMGPNHMYGGMPNRNIPPNPAYSGYNNGQGNMPPNQYGNYNNAYGPNQNMPPNSMPNQAMMNSMNTPPSMNNQNMSPSGKTGAQAAAHAALMAAANSAGGRGSSPFMRPQMNQPSSGAPPQPPPQSGPRMYAPNPMNAMNSMMPNSNQMPNSSQSNPMGGNGPPMAQHNQMMPGMMNNVDSMGHKMPTPNALHNSMPPSASVSPAPSSGSGPPMCSTPNSNSAPNSQPMDANNVPAAAARNNSTGEMSMGPTINSQQPESMAPNSMPGNAGNNAMNSSMPSNMDMISNANEQVRENSTPTCSIASEDSQDRMINNAKSIKENMSHPPTPIAPSPSASLSSFHDETENISSPSWPGTPKTGPNDISRLYELGDEPDRRMFLDRYFALLEEKGIVLNSIPMISKTQVDLYKLYHSVRIRGGLLEVTKTKKWKEICSEINVSGSASAAYTCRKNYVKHLFAFECRYDRCGADPAPLLLQMESFLSKKDKKSRVPSPAGSQGSQDAFRPPSAPHGPPHMMDPYGQRPPMQNHDMSGMPPHMAPQMGPPGNHYGANMPPHNQMMHGAPPPNMPNNNDSISVQDPFADDANNYPRPNMANQMPPYSAMQPNMPNSYGMYNQRPGMPPTSSAPPYAAQQQQQQQQQQQMNSYGPDGQNRIPSQQPSGDSSFQRPPVQQNQGPPPPANISSESSSPMTNQAPGQYSNRMPTPNSGPMPPYRPHFDSQQRVETPPNQASNQQMPPTSVGPPQTAVSTMPVPTPTSTPIKASMAPTSMPPNQSSPAPPPVVSDPSSYPRYPSPSMVPRPPVPDQQQMMPGQYPPPQGPPPNQGPGPMYANNYPGYQQHGVMNQQVPPQPMYRPQRPDMYGSPGQKRFPDQKDGYNLPPPYGEKQMGERAVPYPYSSPRQGMMSNDSISMADNRPRDPSQWQPSLAPRYPNQQPYPAPNMPPHMAGYVRNQRMSPHKDKPQYSSPGKMPHPSMSNAQYPQQKREISFPSDCVESTQPWLAKRKKLTAKDIGPVEGWRIMLSLKSGLLAESTWALDVLNVLLHDDTAVIHFNLKHLPGLVEILLEHFRRCLIDIFGIFEDLEIGYSNIIDAEEKRAQLKEQSDESEKGNPGASIRKTHEVFVRPKFVTAEKNYTLTTRTGKPVKIEETSSNEDVILDDKIWDVYDGFESGTDKWEIGLGDISQHVVAHMESKQTNALNRKLFFGEEISEVLDTRAAAKLLLKSANDNAVTENREELNSRVGSLNCDHSSTSSVNSCKCEKVDTMNNSSRNNENTSNVTIKAEPECVNSKSQACTPESEKNDSSPATKDSSSTSLSAKVEEPSSNSNSSESRSSVKTESSIDSTKNESSSSTSTQEMNGENGASKDANKSEPETTVKTESMDTSCQINGRNNPNTSCLSDLDSTRLNDSLCSDTSILSTGGTSRKRKRQDLEEESYQRDDCSFNLIADAQDEIGKRCVCISNIFRSLSFVPGNDLELSKHPGFLYVMGQLLLLQHHHPVRSRPVQRFDREEVDVDDVDTNYNVDEWWWDYLIELRENAMVIFTNISSQLNLSQFPEEICMPLMDGLLHWAVCPSSCAQDPFPNLPPSSVLSPQRLVLEALCRLCIKEANVDLLLATPPFRRIVDLFASLNKILAYKKEQVLREFAVVLLSHLVASGESSAARAVALQHPSISLLLDFVETAEQNAMQVANTHGINMLRDNPEMMGTSLDMLRRAAMTLLHIARVPENRTIFIPCQSRLLSLVMSQILDQHVAQILSDCLYEISSDEAPVV